MLGQAVSLSHTPALFFVFVSDTRFRYKTNIELELGYPLGSCFCFSSAGINRYDHHTQCFFSTGQGKKKARFFGLPRGISLG